MEARADRPDRASDALRSFLVAQLFELAKHDSFAEFRRQFQHGGTNLLHALLSFGPVHRRDDIGHAGDGARSRFALFVELKFAREALEMLHDAIASDAVEICGKGSALGIVFFRLAHEGHEDVLHDFFGGPGVTGHAQGKTIESGLMAAIEGGEGIFIPFRGLAQENVVPEFFGNAVISRCDCSLAWRPQSICCHVLPAQGAKSSQLEAGLGMRVAEVRTVDGDLNYWMRELSGESTRR
jgi:hypothetical protein